MGRALPRSRDEVPTPVPGAELCSPLRGPAGSQQVQGRSPHSQTRTHSSMTGWASGPDSTGWQRCRRLQQTGMPAVVKTADSWRGMAQVGSKKGESNRMELSHPKSAASSARRNPVAQHGATRRISNPTLRENAAHG